MELLLTLQQIPGPSGDEGAIADYLETHTSAFPNVQVRRVGDLVVAVRGKPRVAVFAHLDTIGFTLGYDRTLIPIGGPKVEGGERLREAGGDGKGRVKLVGRGGRTGWRLSGKQGAPGSRWVYDGRLQVQKDQVSGPYLDNRAGVWNAIRVLERCPDVAVCFTPGEEHTGRGALLGASLLHQELGITRALISDITWHTDHIKCGKGPAISLRDRSLPRQRFLDEVIAAAEITGIPFQREVESSGGSDGGLIDRSTYPIDWVFIGAPQKRSHTPRESCRVRDLEGMVELYCALVPALSA